MFHIDPQIENEIQWGREPGEKHRRDLGNTNEIKGNKAMEQRMTKILPERCALSEGESHRHGPAALSLSLLQPPVSARRPAPLGPYKLTSGRREDHRLGNNR